MVRYDNFDLLDDDFRPEHNEVSPENRKKIYDHIAASPVDDAIEGALAEGHVAVEGILSDELDLPKMKEIIDQAQSGDKHE